MKQRTFITTFLATACLLLISASTSYADHTVVMGGIANMRAKPSAKSTKVGALKAKDRVRIISKSKDLNDPKRMKDLWFKVETEDGKQGWISGSLLAKAKLVPAAMGGAPEMMPSGDSGGASAPAMAPSAPADSEAPAAPSATKPSSSDEIPDIEILDSTDETK
jgi:hypothetical protein